MNRRSFLLRGGFLSAGLLGTLTVPVPVPYLSSPRKKRFSFIHYTDVHVQPELHGDVGYGQAVSVMNRLWPKPAFAIGGGDFVFDSYQTKFERADALYKLYRQITNKLDLPVYHAIGNHDVFGVGVQSGVNIDHPEFGKKMFANRVGEGQTYRSFDFQDWHFVLLDSIYLTPDRAYEGRIDAAQFAWLQNDLQVVGPRRPVVLVTHIPFFSIYGTFEKGATEPVLPSRVIVNTKEVLEFCAGYNVMLILQGHLHIVESHQYKETRYITSGAVCGNWWKGPRMGHPEGFAVYTIEDDQIGWSYHPFGWQADSGS
ncbi:MAG: metallophosphoesterase [Acidobacteria bacterium]|nr:metallophosphoesterase [Acidobacteriota bacterium]MCI0722010.1 metallophosphoesterase [Acidobacteriota bacterium]